MDRFEEFLEEFDRDWIEKVYIRFERARINRTPGFILKKRFALTDKQFSELLRLFELRMSFLDGVVGK